MTSKLNINWLNKCRCGNRMHTVETVRGSHVRLFEDDAVKCNACGREGVIQTCDAIATVLWETDEERAESVTMTKSTITREQLLEIIETDHVQCGEASYLARMALAAMDSEPVAIVEPSDYVTAAQLVGEGPARKAVHELYEGALRIGDKLYRHAQPVLEIESEPVFNLEVTRADYKGQKLGNHFGFITLDAARGLKEGNYQLYTAQLAPVVQMVPEEAPEHLLPKGNSRDTTYRRGAIILGWKLCRAAMLAAAPQEVKP